MIKLIINADDFGMSNIFNEKILELLEKSYIKSTTVMVNRIMEEQDYQIKQLINLYNDKKISIGLHIESDADKPLKSQIKEQREKFKNILGFYPTHLDIHKSMGSKEVVMEVNRFAEEYGLPVRNHGIKANTKQTSYPAFFLSNQKFGEIIRFLEEMKDGSSYELITHPGEYDPACKSSLNKERKDDYDNIIKLQSFLRQHKNIKNISYLEL